MQWQAQAQVWQGWRYPQLHTRSAARLLYQAEICIQLQCQGRQKNENDDNELLEKEQEAREEGYSGVDIDMEEVVPLNGSCLNKLVRIFPGLSVQDHIIKLKARNTSRYAFTAILSNPKKIMEGRSEKLEPNNCPVQVIPYTTVAEVSEIEYALEAFDSRYDLNAITK